jgi:hypothetical protein
VRFALLDRTVSIEEVLRNIGGTGSGGDGQSRDAGVRQPSPRAQAEAPVKSRFAVEIEQPAAPLKVSRPDDVAPAKGSSLKDLKKVMDDTANDGSRTRLSADELRAQKVAALKAKDPVLSAAIDELDLELLD